MTAAHPPLPLTVAGRSPFDEVRVRWGGFGALAFGVGLLFSGNAGGIVFGILLAILGGATLALSRFGVVFWYDIPSPQRYVVGTGAVVGFLTCIVFIGGLWLVATILQAATRNR